MSSSKNKMADCRNGVTKSFILPEVQVTSEEQYIKQLTGSAWVAGTGLSLCSQIKEWHRVSNVKHVNNAHINPIDPLLHYTTLLPPSTCPCRSNSLGGVTGGWSTQSLWSAWCALGFFCHWLKSCFFVLGLLSVLFLLVWVGVEQVWLALWVGFVN